jgi:hypothetical protein
MNCMKTLAATAALLAALGPEAANAQAASEQVKRACRQTADNVAQTIEHAKRSGVKDLEAAIRKPSESWAGQVATYMIQAANRTESLSEAELASLGYAYCVERRPRD